LRKFSALLLILLMWSCARDGSDSVTGTGTTARLSGNHVLRIVVVEQASSPNPYIASGSIETSNIIRDLAPAQGMLKTGDALEMHVSF